METSFQFVLESAMTNYALNKQYKQDLLKTHFKDGDHPDPDVKVDTETKTYQGDDPDCMNKSTE